MTTQREVRAIPLGARGVGRPAAFPLPHLVCEDVLESLPRHDQRACGYDYVHGLLATPGRKSMRNMAVEIGDRGTEQRLHHFISDSTWDWHLVRRAYARQMCTSDQVRAYVLRLSLIPKAGSQTVGVSRQYRPSTGDTVNAQLAAGLWATGLTTVPLNWTLFLPGSGSDVERCLAESLDEVRADLPAAPVLVDSRHLDPGAMVDELMVARTHLLVRVPADLKLDADDPAVGPRSATHRPVSELVGAVRPRPIQVVGDMAVRLAATVRVSAPRRRDGRPVDPTRRLQLIGLYDPRSRQRSYWLAALPPERRGDLLDFTSTLSGIDAEVRQTSADVGLHDFVGRSFSGWNRHMTLASIAYAIRATQDCAIGLAERSQVG